MTLYQCSLKWFKANTCISALRGLSSSFIQHFQDRYFMLVLSFLAHSHLHSVQKVVEGIVPASISRMHDASKCWLTGDLLLLLAECLSVLSVCFHPLALPPL